jgi:hypothetical protein
LNIISSKTCSKCKLIKPLEDFNVQSSSPDGRRSDCKDCRKISSSKYYLSNSEKIKINTNLYGKIKASERKKQLDIDYERYKSQFEAELRQKKLHQKRLKGVADKRYQEANKEARKQYTKEYYLKNKEIFRLNMAEYREKNKDSLRILKRTYKVNRLESDPIYKLKFNLSTLIRNVIKNGGYQKSAKTSEVLGADWSIVKSHIESMFVGGMTWENQGKWHFDHIIPISLAKSEAQVLALNHYTNLRPLWGSENIAKSNKLPSPDEIQRHQLGWLLDTINLKIESDLDKNS